MTAARRDVDTAFPGQCVVWLAALPMCSAAELKPNESPSLHDASTCKSVPLDDSARVAIDAGTQDIGTSSSSKSIPWLGTTDSLSDADVCLR